MQKFQTLINFMQVEELIDLFDLQEDKSTLSKYKEAVEKRLHILEEQGYVYAYETISNWGCLRLGHASQEGCVDFI